MSDWYLWMQGGIAIAIMGVGLYGLSTAHLIRLHAEQPDRCPCHEHRKLERGDE